MAARSLFPFSVRALVSFCALAALLLSAVQLIPERDPAPAPSPTVADGVDADWWARVSRDLTEREYHAGPTAGGWQAPNRAHDLRSIFRADGVEIRPRGSGEPAWTWTWSLRGWGRGDDLRTASPVRPDAAGARVAYARAGLEEWYENSPAGLEQGFQVNTRPPGEGPLVIAGTVAGNLAAELLPAGAGVRFRDAAGNAILDYDGLKVWDAGDRDLPAVVAWHDGHLSLEIDDAGAAYPLTVDPIVSTPSWEEEGNKFDAAFGYTVATAGDVNGDGYSDIIVGSPNYSETGFLVTGKVWVYHGSATGLEADPAWEELGENDGDDFGYSVGSAGDTNADGYDDVIIGAPGWYDDVLYKDGLAYVYNGSAAGLEDSHHWRGNTGNHGTCDYFGWSVGTAGDVNGDGYADIVVGDPYAHNGLSASGRICVWYGSANGIEFSYDWTALGPVGVHAHMGRSVSTAGDIDGDGYDDIVAGAPLYESSGDWEEGGFFVFLGSSSGPSTSYDQLIQSDIPYFRMGHDISLAGDVNGDGYADVLVGCDPNADYCAEFPDVKLYAGTADGLDTTPAWTYGDHLEQPTLGWDVATAGDVNGDGYADFLIGMRGYANPDESEGKLELFYGNFDGPTGYPVWFVEGGQEGARLGPCATAGDVNGDGYSDVIGGMPGYDGTSTDRGLVRCWLGGPLGVRFAAGWVTESNQGGALFGTAVASAGDANGDGYDDLLVGAPYYDNGETNEGAVFLYLGANTGLAWLPAWWAESNQANALFGWSVASAGDVNNDGLPDLLVGAPNYKETASSDGSAFLWHSALGGGPYGNPTNADWQYHSGQDGANLGLSVAGAGDVNGDGYADVAVGAPDYDRGHTNEGIVYVFHGSSGGLPASADWFRDTGRDSTKFGFCVASAGDFNGDGYSDLIVGAPHYTHPSWHEGLAFVYQGGADGLTLGAPWWYAQSDQVGAQLGLSVASAGDVNGDGYSDVIIGAPYYDGAFADDEGLALLWLGGSSAPPTGSLANADWTRGYEAPTANCGGAVACAGDVNNDGYSDVIVGLPGVNFSHLTDSGMAEVFLGSPTEILEEYSDWFDGGTLASSLYGYSVACAGDVNGDGFSDVAIGAPLHTQGESAEGRAFVYYGGGRRGLGRTPRLWQSDLTTRLAPLGMATSTTVGVSARGRMAGGRGNVHLEAEIKPWSWIWTGTGTVTGAWTDTGAPSGQPGSVVDLTPVPVEGLDTGAVYKWRVRLHSDSPYFPQTPWMTTSYNGLQEWGLRISGIVAGAGDVPVVAGNGLRGVPNPFNPSTVFQYHLDRPGRVHLQLFDTRGRLVRTLVDEPQPAGERAAKWDGCDESGRRLASGVYLVRLVTADQTRVTKVTLMK